MQASTGGCRRAVGNCKNRDFISQGESRCINVYEPSFLGVLQVAKSQQLTVTGVVAVAVGVMTIEVVAAEVAMVGVAGCSFGSMAHEWDCLHAGEGGGDDGSDVATIVLSG